MIQFSHLLSADLGDERHSQRRKGALRCYLTVGLESAEILGKGKLPREGNSRGTLTDCRRAVCAQRSAGFCLPIRTVLDGVPSLV
ncbi:hypothetical protein R1flu_001719 [Riccia fluitans]|uniref:Uncharacterized protein n=1 Tax=Riccia fluitans TaxID=41844 RepID=A0ABD1Y814_9MARC